MKCIPQQKAWLHTPLPCADQTTFFNLDRKVGSTDHHDPVLSQSMHAGCNYFQQGSRLHTQLHVLVWHSGSALVSINEVNLRRAWLVLGWVIVSGFNSRCRTFISVCNQSPRPTQPTIPPGSVNEEQLRLGRKRQAWFIPLADEHRVCR